jgi:surface antigen
MTKFQRLLVGALGSALLLPAAASPAFAADTPSNPPAGQQQQPTDVPGAQAKLADLNKQLDTATGDLDRITAQLAADKKQAKSLHDQLAELARLQYQQPVLNISTILGATSLQQLLGDVAQSRLVARKQQDLLSQAQALEARDQQTKDQQTKRLADIKTARQQASQLLAQLVAAHAADSLLSEGRALASPPSPAGPWPNHFFYGQCTWYVATQRYVPWMGNAIDWWANARPYGYAEGQTPQVGAIMVTRESGYGHVAIVRSVNPDGSWTVQEMNYMGFAQVDTRTIQPGFGYLVGFIY